jgi:hypothetical protein
MPLSFPDIRIAVPDRILTRTVDGTTVLLNIDNGRSFTLDDVGTRAWTALLASSSVQHAYETLLDEYQAAPEALMRDLETLIERLAANELLEIHAA